MYNIFQHTQRLTPEPKSSRFQSKNSLLLTRKAFKRLNDWKQENGHILNQIFPSARYCKTFSQSRKTSKSEKPFSSQNSENPYFSLNFAKDLRKTEKSKHLGNDFLRVKYNNEKERICESNSKNISLDCTPRSSPSPTYRVVLKKIPVFEKEIKKPENLTVVDPFADNNFEKMFRKRMLSMEVGKNFFVPMKIPTPKANLLITKKFDDFYAKMTGKNKKIYKNSVDEVFKAVKPLG